MNNRLHKQIARFCIDGVPDEVCGVVIDGKAIRVKNSSSDPKSSFLIDAETYLKYRPDTIFHSHPSGVDGFSEHDLLVAANMELTSYVYIVETDCLQRWSSADGISTFEKVLQP